MANRQQGGICPVCGSYDLEYSGFETEHPEIFYRWECNRCHSRGNEWYSINFIEHEVTFNGKQ